MTLVDSVVSSVAEPQPVYKDSSSSSSSERETGSRSYSSHALGQYESIDQKSINTT